MICDWLSLEMINGVVVLSATSVITLILDFLKQSLFLHVMLILYVTSIKFTQILKFNNVFSLITHTWLHTHEIIIILEAKIKTFARSTVIYWILNSSIFAKLYIYCQLPSSTIFNLQSYNIGGPHCTGTFLLCTWSMAPLINHINVYLQHYSTVTFIFAM